MHKMNYEQLHLAYLPRSAKFYGVRREEVESRLKEGMKIGKYNEWLLKEPRKPKDQQFQWCGESEIEELYFLLEMQGVFGVPELIGFAERKRTRNANSFYFAKKRYSNESPKHMSVTDMALQLLQVLEIIHKSGVVHCHLGGRGAIRWDNDEIKIAWWDSCTFHGDIDTGYGSWNDGQKQQPPYDMICAGRLISEWILQYGSEDKELKRLVEVLTNPEPSMRLSASNAIKALQTGVYDIPEIPNTFDYEALLDCHNEISLSKRVDAHSYSLLSDTKQRKLTDIFKNSSGVKWRQASMNSYRFRSKKKVPRVLFGTLEGNEVCGKIRYGAPFKNPKNTRWGSSQYDMTLLIPHEFFVTQMMSGKKHFPTLLSFEMFRCNECTGVVMTMPRYHRKPRNKNVISMAVELLTALKTLHSYGLIHGDIAPSNIMWDDEDNLILIDYDCVQFIKRATGNDRYRLVGQKGFVSKDNLKTFVADVFSAGKVLEYYSNKWKQRSDAITSLINDMTEENWCKRPSVAEALNRWLALT